MTVHIETSEFDDGAPAVKFQRRTPALSTPEHMKNTPPDTPGDEASVDFLQDLNVVSHSVASASVTDIGMLQALAATGKPVILHATSPYPLPAEEANLRTITTLGQRYPGVPVGYSGHGRGVQISLAAIALRAAEQTAESVPTATVTVLAIADSDSYLKWGGDPAWPVARGLAAFADRAREPGDAERRTVGRGPEGNDGVDRRTTDPRSLRPGRAHRHSPAGCRAAVGARSARQGGGACHRRRLCRAPRECQWAARHLDSGHEAGHRASGPGRFIRAAFPPGGSRVRGARHKYGY